jgi:hypothetical protein
MLQQHSSNLSTESEFLFFTRKAAAVDSSRFFTFFHLECEATVRRSAVTPYIVNQLYVGWSWLWSVPKMVKYLSKSKIN